MTKRSAPRHLADAQGAGEMVFGDRGHLTQNGTGSKSSSAGVVPASREAAR
jgi:hypothetical protein